MNKRSNKFGFIKKRILSFLKPILVSNKHKDIFLEYIETGNLNKKVGIELYDNLLFQMQLNFSKVIGIIGCIIGGLLFEFIGFIIIGLIASYLSIFITYYPFRIILNRILPIEFNNGSQKNYLLRLIFAFRGKKALKIKEYIPTQPITTQRIGDYSPWKCPDCKKRNLISNFKCSNCKYEKYWKCKSCERVNIGANNKCIRCDISKLTHKALSGEWECKKCNEINENTFYKCWKCGVRDESLSMMWECEKCNEIHKNTSIKCWKCGVIKRF